MTGGLMGSVPESYLWMRAAKYLGVPVWDLIERDDGIYWRGEALTAETTEAQAQEDRAGFQRFRNQRLQA